MIVPVLITTLNCDFFSALKFQRSQSHRAPGSFTLILDECFSRKGRYLRLLLATHLLPIEEDLLTKYCQAGNQDRYAFLLCYYIQQSKYISAVKWFEAACLEDPSFKTAERIMMVENLKAVLPPVQLKMLEVAGSLETGIALQTKVLSQSEVLQKSPNLAQKAVLTSIIEQRAETNNSEPTTHANRASSPLGHQMSQKVFESDEIAFDISVSPVPHNHDDDDANVDDHKNVSNDVNGEALPSGNQSVLEPVTFESLEDMDSTFQISLRSEDTFEGLYAAHDSKTDEEASKVPPILSGRKSPTQKYNLSVSDSRMLFDSRLETSGTEEALHMAFSPRKSPILSSAHVSTPVKTSETYNATPVLLQPQLGISLMYFADNIVLLTLIIPAIKMVKVLVQLNHLHQQPKS